MEQQQDHINTLKMENKYLNEQVQELNNQID